MSKTNQNKPKQQKTKKNKVKTNKNNKTKTRNAPVAKSKQRTTGKPRMKATGTSITITHTELITTITRASKDFLYDKFYVNPGNSTTFPWLSRLAPNYESYKFNNLRFEFTTSAPTTLGGTVCMAADYDASDPAPTSKAVMMSYNGARRSAPWDDLNMSCTGIRNYNNTHFVETQTGRTGFTQADFRSTDVCSFILATEGLTITEATDIGELYVTYSVTLKTPQLAALTTPAPSAQKKPNIEVNMRGKVRAASGAIRVPKGWVRYANQGFSAQPISDTVAELAENLAGTTGSNNLEVNALYAFLTLVTGWAGAMTYSGKLKGLTHGSGGTGRLQTVEVIAWDTLSDTMKALVPNLEKIYSESQHDGIPVLGLDIAAITRDLFPEEGLSFEYLVDGTPLAESADAHYYPPVLTGTPFATCWDRDSPDYGDPVPLGSNNHIDYSFHASLLGLPSTDGTKSYYNFTITDFGGVPGAMKDYKVGAVLAPSTEVKANGSQMSPMLTAAASYRLGSTRGPERTYIVDWPAPKRKEPGKALIDAAAWFSSVQRSFITIRASRLDGQDTLHHYRDKIGASVEVQLELPIVCEYNEVTKNAGTHTLIDAMDPPLEKITDIVPFYQYSDWFLDAMDFTLARNRRP